MQVILTLPLPTSINKLYINQSQYNPKTKQYIQTGRRILSNEGRKVKSRIQAEAIMQLKKQNWDFDFTKENFIYQDSIIFFNRVGRDDNNILKLLNDSLESIAYDNDSRVLSRTQRIYYDKDNPRIVVKLSKPEFVGVFDNKEEYEQYYKLCEQCSRFRSGSCTILKDCLSSKINASFDLENKKCTVYKKKK